MQAEQEDETLPTSEKEYESMPSENIPSNESEDLKSQISSSRSGSFSICDHPEKYNIVNDKKEDETLPISTVEDETALSGSIISNEPEDFDLQNVSSSKESFSSNENSKDYKQPQENSIKRHILMGERLTDDLINRYCDKLHDTINKEIEGMLAMQFILLEPGLIREIIKGEKPVCQVIYDQERAHYVVVARDEGKGQPVLVFDPIVPEPDAIEITLNSSVRKQLLILFGHLRGEQDFIEVLVELGLSSQADSWSCGLRAVAIITDIITGNDPVNSEYDLDKVQIFFSRVLDIKKPSRELFLNADLGSVREAKAKMFSTHMQKDGSLYVEGRMVAGKIEMELENPTIAQLKQNIDPRIHNATDNDESIKSEKTGTTQHSSNSSMIFPISDETEASITDEKDENFDDHMRQVGGRDDFFIQSDNLLTEDLKTFSNNEIFSAIEYSMELDEDITRSELSEQIETAESEDGSFSIFHKSGFNKNKEVFYPIDIDQILLKNENIVVDDHMHT